MVQMKALSWMRRFGLEVGAALLSLAAGVMTLIVTWLATFLLLTAPMASGLNSSGAKPQVPLRSITYLAWATASAVTLWVWKLLQNRLLRTKSAWWQRSPAILGFAALVLAVVPPSVYYTAQKTVWQETRRPWQPHANAPDTNQQMFAIRQYRFYPTLVLEFKNERPCYTSRFEFPAREIYKIDSVNWFNGGSAVRIELEYTFQNSVSQKAHGSLFFDFDTATFFSTLSISKSEFDDRMHSWIGSLTKQTTREGAQ